MLILSTLSFILISFILIERTYLVGNTCYYGLTSEDCEGEDFANISCCSEFENSLSVRSQQWTCGEVEQSVREPCGGDCPRSTDLGYYIGSRLLEDYVLCQGNTNHSPPLYWSSSVEAVL